MGVENANTRSTSFWRTSWTIPMWPSKNLFHNSLFRMKRKSTTSILSQNNKACNGRNESVKIVISLHRITPFFHVICKQPTTAKMYKIFIAQKSHCACRVLILATIRRKYFNFLLNKTRSGRELFRSPFVYHFKVGAFLRHSVERLVTRFDPQSANSASISHVFISRH